MTLVLSFVCTRLQINWSQHVERILQIVACLMSGNRRHQQSLEKLRFVFWCFIISLSNLLVAYWYAQGSPYQNVSSTSHFFTVLLHDALSVFPFFSPLEFVEIRMASSLSVVRHSHWNWHLHCMCDQGILSSCIIHFLSS